MENKILYVCTICTKSQPPLIPLDAERKNIMAAVTSMIKIKEMFLLMCGECIHLLDAVIQFQKIAVTGVQNLLQLKQKITNSSNGHTIINNIPEDSTVTSKQKRAKPKHHIEHNYAHDCMVSRCGDIQGLQAISNGLSEEIDIKEEPEFETEPQLDFECEPEESKPDIFNNVISSNQYPEAIATDNTDRLNNIESEVNMAVGTNNIDSKTDRYEANIKIKTEPDCGETTDTCESDYGNEEDLLLAVSSLGTDAPKLAYLKEKESKSLSRSKTNKPKPVKKKRKRLARKRFTRKKNCSREGTPLIASEEKRRHCERIKDHPENLELKRRILERIEYKYRKVTDMSNTDKESQKQQCNKRKVKSRSKQKEENSKPLTPAERTRRHRERLKENSEGLEEARRKKLEGTKSKYKYRKITELSETEQELQRQKWREQNEKRRLKNGKKIICRQGTPLTAAENSRRYR